MVKIETMKMHNQLSTPTQNIFLNIKNRDGYHY